MTKNRLLINSSNGLLWLYIINLKINIISQVLKNSYFKKMMEKILKKDWEKLMLPMPDNNKLLKPEISLLNMKTF